MPIYIFLSLLFAASVQKLVQPTFARLYPFSNHFGQNQSSATEKGRRSSQEIWTKFAIVGLLPFHLFDINLNWGGHTIEPNHQNNGYYYIETT